MRWRYRQCALAVYRKACTLSPGEATVGISAEGTGRDVQQHSCTRCPSQPFLQSGECRGPKCHTTGTVWTIKTAEVVFREMSPFGRAIRVEIKGSFSSDRRITGPQTGTPVLEHSGQCLLSNAGLPDNPEMILLDVYPREMKTRAQKLGHTCSWVLFTIVKKWKWPKCPSGDEQINTVYPYNGVLSPIKRNERLAKSQRHHVKWMSRDTEG